MAEACEPAVATPSRSRLSRPPARWTRRLARSSHRGGGQAYAARSDQSLAEGIEGLGQYEAVLPEGIFEQAGGLAHVGDHFRGVPVEQDEGARWVVRSIRNQADEPARHADHRGGTGRGRLGTGRIRDVTRAGIARRQVSVQGIGNRADGLIGREHQRAVGRLGEPDAQVGVIMVLKIDREWPACCERGIAQSHGVDSVG